METFISWTFCCCLVAIVMSNSLWPHGLQHARLPCPSLSSRVCSHSCPLSRYCYLTIWSSAAHLSFCLHSSGSFLMSWIFTSGGQSIWSFSFSISHSNEYSGLISFRIDWFDLPVVQGSLKSLFQHHNLHQFFGAQPPSWSNSLIHTWLLEKP